MSSPNRTRTRLVVAHVIGAFVSGGAERLATSIARQLQGRFDMAVWALSSRTDVVGRSMADELRQTGVSVEVGPSIRVGARSITWYARMLRAHRPSIVHLHTPNTESVHFLASYLGHNWQHLFRTVHNVEIPTGLLVRQAYRFNAATLSIGCGEAALRAHASLMRGPSMLIMNGVDFGPLATSSATRDCARAALQLEPQGVHIVNVGRMSGTTPDTAQKAHDVLLAAWQMSGVGSRGAVLHLLGDGSLRPMLEETVAGDRSIRFHGVRSDVSSWLLAADGFVMPSRFEGLPLAGVEAIGAGLPCIFSDIAPLRELDPPAARWIPVGDVASLAAALARLEALVAPSDQAVAEFRARFSLERVVRQYAEVYDHACMHPAPVWTGHRGMPAGRDPDTR